LDPRVCLHELGAWFVARLAYQYFPSEFDPGKAFESTYPFHTNAFSLLQAFRQGVTNMDLKFLGTQVLRPLCLFCLAALVVPFLLALVIIHIFFGKSE
jgi:hypothetical protein